MVAILCVSCGSGHSTVIIDNGSLYTWGQGEDGQLGLGDAAERHSPTLVTALVNDKLTEVVCGSEHVVVHSVAAKKTYSWGWGDFGRLGHGDFVDVFLPKSIAKLNGISISQIACGDTHCHAVAEDGTVYSWGRNQDGQLGLGEGFSDRTEPTVLESLKEVGVKMVACGAEHSVACTRDGEVFSWGWNNFGCLGLGDKEKRLSPTKLAALEEGKEKAETVACGWRHSCIITTTGRLFIFGWSRYGQLGLGDNEEKLLPTELSVLGKVKVVQAGWRHTVAIDAMGKLHSWGWNRFGQLGIGTKKDENTPCLVNGHGELGTKKVMKVSCGWRHTLCVAEDGALYAFGRGVNGQLGRGDIADLDVPTTVPLNDAVESNGAEHRAPADFVAIADRYAVVPGQEGEEGIVPSPHVKTLDNNIPDVCEQDVDEEPARKRTKEDEN